MRSAVVLVLATLAAAAVTSAPAAVVQPRLVQISADTFPEDVPGSHATEVEPSAAVSGSTIVAAFQVGRNYGGGAAAIGYATSRDGGASWASGLLPSLTPHTSPPGSAAFVSDPVVAYDAEHGRWLVSTLVAKADQWGLLVSTSPDGMSWSAPSTALATEPQTIDKDWMTCDDWPASPFRGHCYLAYSSWEHSSFGGQTTVAVQASTDGGVTWGPQVFVPVDYDPATDTLSAEPVVRPNGELVIVFYERPDLKAVRSTDGGSTFGPRETVSDVLVRPYSFQPSRLRNAPIPTVAVDDAGTVYAAWYDCRFRSACLGGNDIVLARSSRPGRWTAPNRIPLRSPSPGADFLFPALAVAPDTRGATAHVALGYYALSSYDCTGPECELRAGLATSHTGGRTWTARSVGEPMALDSLAPTSIGRMVGDYFGAVFVSDRVVGIFSLARPGRSAPFDQAIYAASVPALDPPRNTSRPSIAGRALVGRTLTCLHGSWTGAPVRYSYRWLRRGRELAAAQRYRIRARDVGLPLACRVRATNAGGTSQATSRPVQVGRR